MKRNCKYPFKSDFYHIDEIFEDTETHKFGITARQIMCEGLPHSTHMDYATQHECELARLLLRIRHDLYRRSDLPREDFKHMTITIDNY
jgi:hypothetical protein